ncbi:serine O-acetyltransferase [Nocardioides antri]|uniref:Serine O-acetyltransferase n=1 Tax=Nocardioides antri TaxID=2607659 RepID=A0A5B1M3H8_9ACTN|nr:serine O-acetyltransferase [Nocardioides antri]KAA1427472.1 serine O-acetyltransferase [Nocardioides antri]
MDTLVRSRGLRSTIEADLRANVDPTQRTGIAFWAWVAGKALFAPQVHAVVLYRFASVLARTPLRPVALLLRSIGLVWSGAEIHPDAQFGPGLALVHSNGVVIGGGVRGGVDCRINPGVVLGEPGRGSKGDYDFPVLGDHVTLGAHAVVLGPLRVGDGSVVGANSVVRGDVPDNVVVAGAPARVIRRLVPYEQDPSRATAAQD